MRLKFSADCLVSFSAAIFNFSSSINVADLKRNVVEPEVESFSLPISQSDLVPAERHNIYVRFKRRPRQMTSWMGAKTAITQPCGTQS